MPIKKIVSALFLTLSLSGCTFLTDTFVYQIDVTQGNYINDEKIEQIETGMSQEQIIYILGSPMLIDQFDSSKWYYIRYIKPGGKKIQQQQVLLVFKNKTLVEIKNQQPIEETPFANTNIKNEPNAAAQSNSQDSGSNTDNSAPGL